MDAVQPVKFIPYRRLTRLARLGDWMARHGRSVLAIQRVIVVFYALLVVVPTFLPHPNANARLFSDDLTAWHARLVLLAQYLFWGVWWPFVILSMMLVGRFWCGVLCPEGALAEFASRHGRGGTIPKWIRWSGWPVLAWLPVARAALLAWLPVARAALLALGAAWSGWLGARLIVTARPGYMRGALALAAWAAPVGAVVTAWFFVFFV